MRRALALVVMVLAIMIIAVSCEDHVHTYSDDWTSDETSHWHAATCEHTTEVKDKAEHVWGEYVIDKDSTETEKGSKHRVCSVCGYIETSVIAEKQHDHNLVYRYNSSKHWQVCTKCGEEFDAYSHSFSYVNAGSSGHYQKCHCGYSTSVVAHTYGTEEASAAGGTVKTCTACGHKDILTKQAETTTTVSDIIKEAGVTKGTATDESGKKIAVKKTNNTVLMTTENIAAETTPSIAEGETATTTVSFPAGALKIKEDAEEVKLTVITAPATVASLNSSGYQITTSEETGGQQETKTDTTQAVVAGFEFNLEGAVASDLTGTETEGKKNVGTTITTYIAAGLGEYEKGNTGKQPIEIKYISADGQVDDKSTPIIESYDNSNGKLVFTVYHFSKYIVISNQKKITDSEGKMYTGLDDEAIAGAKEGTTFTLLADIELKSAVEFGKTATLNLNGKKLTLSESGALTVKKETVLTIENRIDGQDGLIRTGVRVGSDSVNGVYYPTLEEAVKAETSGNTIVLLEDAKLSKTISIDNGKTYVIDLNGKTIEKGDTPIEIKHGTITFTGTGIIQETQSDGHAPIVIYGSTTDVGNYSVVNIGKGVTLKGWSGLFVKNNAGHAYGVVVNMSGKIDVPAANGHKTDGQGVYINGEIVDTTGHVPEINLDGATIESDNVGIYAAGYGIWNIKNTTINGVKSAVEIRAGELNIESGSYKATAQDYAVVSNDKGETVTGAAIAVSQHTTKLPITVTISGGTFEGKKQLAVVNPESNKVEFTKSVKVILKNNVNLNNVVGYAADTATSTTYYVNSDSAKEDGVGAVARIGEEGNCTYYLTLQEAVDAGDNKIISLRTNVDLKEKLVVSDGKKITINMNGYTITKSEITAISLQDASLELTGNGTIVAGNNAICVEAIKDKETSLVVGKDIVLKGGSAGCGLLIAGHTADDRSTYKKITVDFNGKVTSGAFGISINGLMKKTSDNDDAIKINDGASFSNIASSGIYIAGYSNWTIGNIAVEAVASAIEIRAGKVNISGGTYVASATNYSVVPNENGNTTVGAALVVAQHTTKLPINVTVTGGSFSGVKQLAVVNPQKSTAEESSKVKVIVSGVDLNEGQVVGIKVNENIYYPTLEAAVKQAKEKSTITLLEDIDLTNYVKKNDAITGYSFEFTDGITFDLNSHAIKVNNYGVVWRGKGLTIKNGTFNAVENSEKSSGYDSYALFIRGTDDDGALTDETKKEWVATVENVECRGGINVGCHKLVIRESEVGGTNYYAFFADTNAEITIESGTYTSTSTDAGCVLSTGKGGTSNIIIEGGEFTGSEKVSVFTSEKARQNFKVTGGTFSSNPAAVEYSEDGQKKCANYVADGYESVPDKTGAPTSWTVQAKTEH